MPTSRKVPTLAVHFTHIDNLPTIVQEGVLPDTSVQGGSSLRVEVGNTSIKERRRNQIVPLDPGGSVGDYVPFYFGPRSPMMYSIAAGNVDTYKGGTSSLVYLVTTLEWLLQCGCTAILSDRNAALAYAEYRQFHPDDPIDDGFIDWDLITARYWNDFPDGKERRMAECLVSPSVPWSAIQGIAVHDERVGADVQGIIARAGSSIPIRVRPNWYF